MSWSAPPVFTVGQVLTAAQQNILSDDLTYLKANALDYKEVTTPQTSTATTAAAATAIITGNAVTYDGSTIVAVEFYAGAVQHSAANALVLLNLYDGATDLGIIARLATSATAATADFVSAKRQLTPSAAAHTYSIRAWTTIAGTITAAIGAGGPATDLPMFMRITKA